MPSRIFTSSPENPLKGTTPPCRAPSVGGESNINQKRVKDNVSVVLSAGHRGGAGKNENSPPSEGWQPKADGVVFSPP